MAKFDLTFLEFLQTFRRGELLTEADDLLSELMEAIGRTGQKGEITLKLPFKPNDNGQIECVPVFSVKKPRKPMSTGIYFVSEDSGLTRRDPKQDDLFDEVGARRDRDVN